MLLNTGGLSRETVAEPARHGQRDTGLGPLDVVGTVTRLGHSVLGVGRFMGTDHDAVFQPQVFELVGLEQRVLGRNHRNEE